MRFFIFHHHHWFFSCYSSCYWLCHVVYIVACDSRAGGSILTLCSLRALPVLPTFLAATLVCLLQSKAVHFDWLSRPRWMACRVWLWVCPVMMDCPPVQAAPCHVPAACCDWLATCPVRAAIGWGLTAALPLISGYGRRMDAVLLFAREFSLKNLCFASEWPLCGCFRSLSWMKLKETCPFIVWEALKGSRESTLCSEGL